VMSLTFQPYNLTLPSFSPVFTYLPYRDGGASLGWNSSYSDYSLVDALNNQAAVGGGYFRGVGTAYRTTSYSGASVNLNFTGTAIYLCFSTEGPSTFTVDGQQLPTTVNQGDAACAVYGSYATGIAVAANLSLGMHTATLEGSGGSTGGMNFYGAVVTMEAGQPGPKKTQVIGSDDGGWNWESVWDPETDDTYMWNGKYRSGANYDPSTVASYTFQGASAIVLRGLSMYNYGPYTINLDDNQTAAFNASEQYWRHSETVLYFASGLDPAQSHTIKVINYDPNHPNPTSISPVGALSASVSTLTLIMDDTASRDALLSTSPTPAPAASASGVSVGTIVAAVLGGLLLLLLGSNAFFIVLWRRVKKEMQFTRFAATSSELEKDVLPPAPLPWAMNSQPSSVALLSAETLSQTSSAATPPTARMSSYTATTQRPEKRPLRTVNADPVEMDPISPHNPGQSVAGSYRPEAGGSGSAYARPNQEMAAADPRALGELVNGLSSLLNGHLRDEYLQRERIHEQGLDVPPEYGNN